MELGKMKVINVNSEETIERILEKLCEAISKQEERDQAEADERQESQAADPIHHPDHYTWKGVECKEIIEIMTRGLSGIEAYYMGNIIKYLYRYPKKGTLETDLMKAGRYMDFLKDYFRKGEEKHE